MSEKIIHSEREMEKTMKSQILDNESVNWSEDTNTSLLGYKSLEGESR